MKRITEIVLLKVAACVLVATAIVLGFLIRGSLRFQAAISQEHRILRTNYATLGVKAAKLDGEIRGHREALVRAYSELEPAQGAIGSVGGFSPDDRRFEGNGEFQNFYTNLKMYSNRQRYAALFSLLSKHVSARDMDRFNELLSERQSIDADVTDIESKAKKGDRTNWRVLREISMASTQAKIRDCIGDEGMVALENYDLGLPYIQGGFNTALGARLSALGHPLTADQEIKLMAALANSGAPAIQRFGADIRPEVIEEASKYLAPTQLAELESVAARFNTAAEAGHLSRKGR